MKLTIILLTAFFLQVAAAGHSQTVNFSGKEVSLKKVFTAIKTQTGNVFFYDIALLREAKPVTVDLKNAPLENALNEIFKDQPLTWLMENKTITIIKKPALIIEQANVELPPPPPPLNITGTVTNEKGEPVVGASVTIKGTGKGTTTDDNGNFALNDVDKNAILVISGTNIETAEVKLQGRTSVNISTKIKVSSLDDVQLIGYGATTKRLNTGTIATVKGEDIKDRPVSNIMHALQGKMPGVAILTTGAGIGSPPQILIRGINSITSGTNPLIIVDGVVVSEQLSTTTLSAINFINPADVESIDVLKDADATGIYGSRGTNGVILITTKKASIGKSKFSAHVSTGWKSPTIAVKRMNTQQYLQMRKDAFAMGNATATSAINPITPTTTNAPDLLVYDQNAYTNFTKLETQSSAPNYNADISLSGGTKALNFVAAASYYRMYDTYLFDPYQERANGRFQLNHTSLNNKFNFRIGSTFGLQNQQLAWLSGNGGPIIIASSFNPPNFPLYKADGSMNLGPGYTSPSYFGYNPYVMKTTSTRYKSKNLLMNTELSYTIIKGLVAKVQASYGSQSMVGHTLFPSTSINSQDILFNPNPYGSHNSSNFTSVNLEPQLSYTRRMAKASITALAGATYLDKKAELFTANVANPGSDGLLSSYGAGQPTTTTSNNTEEKFESLFGRLNADWDKKYLLNLSFRRDGSSRFGTNNRFANFASVGAGWIFTSEPFFKNNLSFLSYGKLRGSYGTSGNNNIPDYQYLGLLTTPQTFSFGSYPGFAYQGLLGPANYPNADIKWETTTKRDIGLELGLFKNRVLITGTWYRSSTTDLLINLPLGAQSGFSSYYGNFPGVVQNTGLELNLTTQNLGSKSKVKWTTEFNLTNNKNILKSFPNLAATTYATSLEVGRALNSSTLEYPYHFTGVDPATGLPLFEDVNKDGIINFNDNFNNSAWIGSAKPTLWGGLTNTVSYKGFSLEMFLQFSNGIFTRWNYYSTIPIGTQFNPSADVAGNYWTKPGDVAKYPRLYTNTPGVSAYITPITQYYPQSTAFLYKGYYVRLKNVELSYILPARLLTKLKASNITLYMSGENLAVYCPGKLMKEPEVSSFTNTNGLLRTITTGLRVEF